MDLAFGSYVMANVKTNDIEIYPTDLLIVKKKNYLNF